MSGDVGEEDVDGFERASIQELRARVEDLEDRVAENEALIQMAAERLEQIRSTETEAE